MIRRTTLLVCLTVVLACGRGDVAPSTPRTTRSGDTTFVVIPAGFDTAAIRIERADVLWKDDRLAEPSSVALVNGRLVIADRESLHFLDGSGTYLGTSGRLGQGPGEFGQIAAIGRVADRIVALDSRNMRYAVLDTLGVLVGTHGVRWPYPYVNPQGAGGPLRPWKSGVLRTAAENVHLDRATRLGLIWDALDSDSTAVLRSWDDITWTDLGVITVPEDAYPSRALVAIGNEGRFAWSDGLEYCVSIESLEEPGVIRSCRERPRTPVGPGARHPSVDEVSVPPTLKEGLRAALREQSVREYVPSLDQMVFSEEGLLWIRALGSDAPDVHPILRHWLPGSAPAYRRWEALDRRGYPAGALLLPSAFEPRVFLAGEAFGLLTLDSGEIVVAKVAWKSEA
jgi:hypothetical protein